MPEPSALSILREARGLCAQGWCQRAAARNASGRRVQPTARTASCFCASGAIARAAGGYDTEAFAAAVTAVSRALPLSDYLLSWNDAPGRTQAEVLSLFDKAIASLETPHAR